MGIPIGQRSTTRITGSASKVCTCESCQTEYVYVVERMGVGEGSSLLWLDNAGAEDRATSRAEKNLVQELEQAIETVPCPQCGWLQAAMVTAEKRSRLEWCLWASLPLSVILLIVGLFYLSSSPRKTITFVSIAGACAVTGIATGIIWRIKHDPNAGHDGPGTICKERAASSSGMTKQDFEALILAQQAQNLDNPSI